MPHGGSRPQQQQQRDQRIKKMGFFNFVAAIITPLYFLVLPLFLLSNPDTMAGMPEKRFDDDGAPVSQEGRVASQKFVDEHIRNLIASTTKKRLSLEEFNKKNEEEMGIF